MSVVLKERGGGDWERERRELWGLSLGGLGVTGEEDGGELMEREIEFVELGKGYQEG